jgi:hypothetical protein
VRVPQQRLFVEGIVGKNILNERRRHNLFDELVIFQMAELAVPRALSARRTADLFCEILYEIWGHHTGEKGM